MVLKSPKCESPESLVEIVAVGFLWLPTSLEVWLKGGSGASLSCGIYL